MKTSLQLYTIRKTIVSDIRGHLEAVKEMGYDGAEFGSYGAGTIEKIAAAMKDLGLEIFSIHTDIAEVERCDRGQLAAYRDFGCRYMPIGWLPEARICGGAEYADTRASMVKFAETAAEYGISLLYHNHDFDFDLLNGAHKLDLLYADLDAKTLGAELDVCWVYTGCRNTADGGPLAKPVEYLRKYAGRCPVLHLKDCVEEGGRKGFRALGEGVLDFAPIVKAAGETGVEWLCVEQDEPTPGLTPMECAAKSAAFLKTLL